MDTPIYSSTLALDLCGLCKQSYLQYDCFLNKKPFSLPAEYILDLELFTEYEDKNPPIGFIASKNDDCFIVWRGTDNLQEWIQDIKFDQTSCDFFPPNIEIELGFKELYFDKKIKTQRSSRNEIKDFFEKNKYIKNLYITGHSLGGALATINALDLSLNFKKNPVVYTFAAPRSGNLEFAFTYNHKIPNTWRVANSHDEVPNLPPKSCPPITHKYHYKHVNHEKKITFGNFWNLPLNHSVDHYLNELSNLASDNLETIKKGA